MFLFSGTHLERSKHTPCNSQLTYSLITLSTIQNTLFFFSQLEKKEKHIFKIQQFFYFIALLFVFYVHRQFYNLFAQIPLKEHPNPHILSKLLDPMQLLAVALF